MEYPEILTTKMASAHGSLEKKRKLSRLGNIISNSLRSGEDIILDNISLNTVRPPGKKTKKEMKKKTKNHNVECLMKLSHISDDE